jgi:hypothetical protein
MKVHKDGGSPEAIKVATKDMLVIDPQLKDVVSV